MNTFETGQRSALMPPEPAQRPTLVACLLATAIGLFAGAGYLLGHPDCFQSDNARNSVDQSKQASQQQNAGIPTYRIIYPIGVKGPNGSSNPVADVVASTSPAVVSIDTTIKSSEAPSTDIDSFISKPKNPFFGEPKQYTSHGSGSGIIVRPNGYILTNNHVVKNAIDIKVTLNDKRVYKGQVVGNDSFSDVAIVKIDAGHLPVVRLGKSDQIRPGDWAIAIGTPLGLNHTVTLGIVSAVGRSLSDLNNNVELIQTDAAINPGSSGGPLLNIDGDVIGINMAIRTDAQSIGFSIPIDVAKESMTSILEHRSLGHPYLGVSMKELSPTVMSIIGLPADLHGVMVSKVGRQSPAFSSGILQGDIIESINGSKITSAQDVRDVIRKQKIGSHLQVKVSRAGKAKSFDVRLSEYPSDPVGI